MKILLDTHIILWALTEDDRLSKRARSMIENDDNDIYYSIASVWETEIKYLAHPKEMTLDGRRLVSYCDEAEFFQLTIKNKHIWSLRKLKRYENSRPHKDPFDRIMLCQAMEESMLFLTHDKLLMDYQLPNVLLV